MSLSFVTEKLLGQSGLFGFSFAMVMYLKTSLLTMDLSCILVHDHVISFSMRQIKTLQLHRNILFLGNSSFEFTCFYDLLRLRSRKLIFFKKWVLKL